MNERPVIVTSGDALQVVSKGDLCWSLTIADLVFVDEYTTSAGPADDCHSSIAGRGQVERAGSREQVLP